MKIACVGWGSLIWRPENLLIRRQWFTDGPLLPIEFARQSKNGRLTLVITESSKPVRTLWALMATDDLSKAKKSLQEREGTSEKNIASITATEDAADNIKQIIKDWIISLKIDAAIWTNLPPKFNSTEGRVPTIEDAVSYLRSITDINTRTLAEEYIRKTPKQIDTDYRRRFEADFGWTYID
jgi:hypothetical protein